MGGKERCLQASIALPFQAKLKGATLRNWGVLIFGRRNEVDRDLDGFIRTLCQTADEKGVQITQREPLKQYADMNWSPDELTKRLQQDIMPGYNRRGNIELLLVITPSKTSLVYAPIKRYCDSVAGIASQCIVKFNIKRKSQDRGFAFNMLMKINSKLGGINVTLREMPQIVKSGTVYSHLKNFLTAGLLRSRCNSSTSWSTS